MSIWIPASPEHMNMPVTAACSWGSDYQLITAYPFMTGIKGIPTLEYAISTSSAKFRIMDSGIYSLGRDKFQGRGITAKYLEEYTDKYIALIRAVKWPGVVVEVDSHTILRDDLALLARLRKKFEDAGLADQTLFAWHIPEGVPGLLKLLETRKRVAVAPREMFLFSNKDNSVFRRLVARYHKQFSRCHIHCLGTNRMGVQDMPDNFSYDTTSWGSISQYGLTDAGYNTMLFRGETRQYQPHIKAEVMSHMEDMLNVYRHHPDHHTGNKIRRNYLTMMSCALRSTVLHYESVRRKTPGSDFTIVDPLDYALRNR